MKIGIIQTNTGHDVPKNINGLEALLSDVGEADVVITPECTNIMGYSSKTDTLSIADEDEVVRFCQHWARVNATYLIVGSVLVLNENAAPVNRQLVINSHGQIVAHYDKIHMFDVKLPNGEIYRESERTHAGKDALVTEISGVKFGHSICFDLRFPALYAELSRAGADVLLVPAAFTQLTGHAHWEALLRARAIENGAFVVAVGQCDSYTHLDGTTRHCWGHSLVISPWGEVLSDLGEKPVAQRIDLDLNQVIQARRNIPILTARRDIPAAKVIRA